MSYLNTGIQQPGIIELLLYKSSTGEALSHLAHTLLHGPSGLSKAEREQIAAYVSSLNECAFCYQSHRAAAVAHAGNVSVPDEECLVIPIHPKMKALLAIAAKVKVSGKQVTPADMEAAKAAGASDEDLHDTVLIAAAFCMFNRYVDGLGTSLPENPSDFKSMGQRMASRGYAYPPKILRKLMLFWTKLKS